MNCNEARQHLMLYLDSEGDPELHFRISDHLAMCPECAEWFAKQQRFEQAVNERLAEGEATLACLWRHAGGCSMYRRSGPVSNGQPVARIRVGNDCRGLA